MFSACSKIVRAKRAFPKPSPRGAASKIAPSVASAPSASAYSCSPTNLCVDREELVVE